MTISLFQSLESFKRNRLMYPEEEGIPLPEKSFGFGDTKD
jgi:hypothetical protein